jgi:predicted ester cyclase
MGIEQHKTLIQRYVAELNRRNLAILDELVAADVIIRSLNRAEQTPADVLRGREAYRAGILHRLAAFPDYQVTIVELLAEGN